MKKLKFVIAVLLIFCVTLGICACNSTEASTSKSVHCRGDTLPTTETEGQEGTTGGGDYYVYSDAIELLNHAGLVIEGEILESTQEELDLRTEQAKNEAKDDDMPPTYFTCTIYSIKIIKIYKQIDTESEFTVLKEADERFKKATTKLVDGDVIKVYEMEDGFKDVEKGKPYYFVLTTAPDIDSYWGVSGSQSVYSLNPESAEAAKMLESILNELGKEASSNETPMDD